MPFLRIFPVLGAIVMVFALTMLVPLGVSAWTHDGAEAAYPLAMLVAFAVGLLMRSAVWRVGRHLDLQARDGILLVGMVWTLLPLFASLPLLLYFSGTASPMSFTDAYFESMSGLTTTGATVLVGLDALPASINLWRCFLQWLGGMGILVLAVAILPMLGVGGSQLFRAEATGPMKDAKLTPRITETAKGLWSVYSLLSLACVLGYWLAGMPALDAWIHMFSTLSLGGLSSHDSSFGFFQSPAMEWVAIVFMLLASCNFALYFVAMRKGRWDGFWRDPEMRATLAVLLGGGLIVALLLWAKGVYGPVEALRYGIFHVVSVATTTGFTTVDYLSWPVFAPVLMLLLSGVATSAGSTGGGIKMVRMLILLKQARRELTRLVHPRAMQPVRLGNGVVDDRMIFSVLAFMLVYGATVITLSMVLLLTDLDPVTAFSAVLASVHCTGPGLGALGPSSNYAVLTDFQTWICTLAMLLGRLEILSFMALLSPAFWRR